MFQFHRAEDNRLVKNLNESGRIAQIVSVDSVKAYTKQVVCELISLLMNSGV